MSLGFEYKFRSEFLIKNRLDYDLVQNLSPSRSNRLVLQKGKTSGQMHLKTKHIEVCQDAPQKVPTIKKIH